MKQWKDQLIEGTKYDIGTDIAYCFGPNTELRGCELLLRTNTKALTITATKLLDCTIHAKKRLSHFPWCWSYQENCKFKGTFSGNEFGHWPEHYWEGGGIKGGNFSEATLDGSRFVNCDMSSIILPSWPCFTIFNPCQLVARLKAVSWPGTLSYWIDGIAYSPPITSAIVEYAPAVAKSFKVSEDELREAINRFKGIKI